MEYTRLGCLGCRAKPVTNKWQRHFRGSSKQWNFKAMLHEVIFLASCNATMTNKNPFKLQRGCYPQATCLATLRKVEGRSTFLATRNARITVAKSGVTREIFLTTCNAAFAALQVARKIASWNMAFKDSVQFRTVVLAQQVCIWSKEETMNHRPRKF